MRSEHDIYNDIGAILMAIVPNDASKVMLQATLSPEGDHCKCEFDYIDKHTGDINWFSAGMQANSDLMDLLVELRNFFAYNTGSDAKKPWHDCGIVVDVESLKISINFKYDDEK